MNAKSGKKPEVKPVVTTAQTKTAEVKPAETKEAEVKPAETKTLEAKAAEVKSSSQRSRSKGNRKVSECKRNRKRDNRGCKRRSKESSKEKKPHARQPLKKESESETEVFVEYYGQQSSVEEITNKVKEVFVSEGHRVSTIKSLKAVSETGRWFCILCDQREVRRTGSIVLRERINQYRIIIMIVR